MGVDYSKLSDSDLAALSKKNYGAMSDAGLAALAGAGPIERRATPRTGPDSATGATLPTPTGNPADVSGARLAAERERFKRVANDTPWLERNLAAAGGAVVGMKHGLQSLGHDIAPSVMDAPAPEDVEMQKALAKEAPVGDIAGQLSTLAIPGPGALTGATKLLSRFGPTAAKFGAMPLAAGVQGGTLTAPSEDESRLGNVGTAAAFGSALQQGGRALGRTLTGLVKPNLTEDAKRIIREGTRGLGTGESQVVPTIAGSTEGGMGTIVGGAQKIGDLLFGKSKRFSGEVIDQAVRESVPYPSQMVSKPGKQTGWVAEGQEQFNKAYESLLGSKKVPLTDAHKDALIADAQNYLAGTHTTGPIAAPESIGKVSAVLEKAWNKANDAATSQKMSSAQLYQEYRNQIAAAARDMGNNPDSKVMSEALSGAQKRLDSFAEKYLGPDTMQNLAILHQRNVGFHVIGETLRGLKTSLPMSVEALAKVAHKEAPGGLSRSASGKFEHLTVPAQTIVNREAELGAFPKRAAYLAAGSLAMGALPAIAGAGLLGVPAILVALGLGAAAKTKAGAAHMMGLYSHQDKLAELIRKYGSGKVQDAGARFAASPEHNYGD